MKYLLKKEIHNKNEDNTLKEQNEIFLTVMVCLRNVYQNTTKTEVKALRAEPPLPKDGLTDT